MKFKVKKIRYRNTETCFSVVEIEVLETDVTIPTTKPVVIGLFPLVDIGDVFEGIGQWNKHFIYHWNFQLDNANRVWPTSLTEIQHFLQRNVKGLGKKALSIVEYLGVDTLNRIYANPDVLKDIKGIGEKRREKIVEVVQKHRDIEFTILYLVKNGLTYRTAFNIYEKYGIEVIEVIKKNPYALYKMKNITFLEMDKLAKSFKIPFLDKERLKVGLLHYLESETRNNGHLFLYEEDIRDNLLSFLVQNGAMKSLNGGMSDSLYKEIKKELVESKEIFIDTDAIGYAVIYKSINYVMEEKIHKLLENRIKTVNPFAETSQITNFIEKYEKRSGFTLAYKQKESVYMALKKSFCILTGGPGTGKTQTINTIIEGIKDLNPVANIVLCAPTGKASKRMTELTNMEAKTIYRTLNIQGLDLFSTDDELEADFVIIDESSMIDIYVFYKLLASITSDTRIIFVGDYNQLPSVGPGLVLRDLIESERVPTVQLNEIFRQAQDSQIVMNSKHLIEGKKELLTKDHTKGDYFFLNYNQIDKVQHYMIKSVKRFLEKGYTLDEIQVLTPQNTSDLGTKELNRIMQAHFNPTDVNKKEFILEGRLFREGDKVIQLENNYELNVFNGETGIINYIGLGSDGEFCIEVKFDEDRFVCYPEQFIKTLDLAYALTIHKTQGSEYPIVIMILHSIHKNMLNRNIIYTGWTRAKETLINIGEEDVLYESIDKGEISKRNSLLKTKLRKIA